MKYDQIHPLCVSSSTSKRCYLVAAIQSIGPSFKFLSSINAAHSQITTISAGNSLVVS